MLASQEVHDISVAIGIDPDSDDLSQLRYGKIQTLRMRTPDGLHIATLLCALFVKHFKNAGEKRSRPTWRCRRCTVSTLAKRFTTR